MAYLYRHIRLDKNEPFYIGVGGLETFDDYNRAYDKIGRNKIWKRITTKTSYEIEILLDDLTKEEVLIKETEFVKLYGRINIKTGTLANLTDGGQGGGGHVVPEELKNYLRSIYSGKPRPEHVKRAMNRLGWHHTEESKKKIGNSVKGKGNPFYGKNHSKETKNKISKINSDGRMKGENNPFYGKKQSQTVLERVRTKVLNIETGIYYDSILEASQAANMKYSTFRAMLNGRAPNKTNYVQLKTI